MQQDKQSLQEQNTIFYSIAEVILATFFNQISKHLERYTLPTQALLIAQYLYYYDATR